LAKKRSRRRGKEVDREEIDCEADAISNCAARPEPLMRGLTDSLVGE
jgi:hypothetical protein